MSKSIRPWITDYLLTAAKTYGVLEKIPREARRLVQLTMFITFGESNDGEEAGEAKWIWADVADGETCIRVRLSKETADKYERIHQKRLTSLKTALGNMINFKIALSRIPREDRTLTERHHLCFQAEGFEPVGSFGEACIGNPAPVHRHPHIKEWLKGLREGGGGGYILKDRAEAKKANKISKAKPSIPVEQPPEIELPQVTEASKVVQKLRFNESLQPTLNKILELTAKGIMTGRVNAACNKRVPLSYIQAGGRMDERPRKRQRLGPVSDPLDLDAGSSPASKYSVKGSSPTRPMGIGETPLSPVSEVSEVISNWEATPPRPARIMSVAAQSPNRQDQAAPPSSPLTPLRLSKSENFGAKKDTLSLPTSKSFNGYGGRVQLNPPVNLKRRVSPPRRIQDIRGAEAVELAPNSDTSMSQHYSQSQPKSQSQDDRFRQQRYDRMRARSPDNSHEVSVQRDGLEEEATLNAPRRDIRESHSEKGTPPSKPAGIDIISSDDREVLAEATTRHSSGGGNQLPALASSSSLGEVKERFTSNLIIEHDHNAWQRPSFMLPSTPAKAEMRQAGAEQPSGSGGETTSENDAGESRQRDGTPRNRDEKMAVKSMRDVGACGDGTVLGRPLQRRKREAEYQGSADEKVSKKPKTLREACDVRASGSLESSENTPGTTHLVRWTVGDLLSCIQRIIAVEESDRAA